MTHRSGHIIIDAVEKKIPKTQLKVRDLLGIVAGIVGAVYWPF